MTGALALDVLLGHLQPVALAGELGVMSHGQVAPGLEPRGGQRLDPEVRQHRRQVVDGHRLADDRLQCTQRRVEVVGRLDLLGLGQLVAGTGFQDIGAGPLAALEQSLVEAQLLGVGTPLGLGQGNLLLGEQCLAVGAEQPHHQLLATPAKAFVGQRRLGRATAVLAPGGVVEQRLLQGQGGGVAAVVALGGGITELAALGHLGVVARTVVAVRQVGQQPGMANRQVFEPGGAFGDRGFQRRVVTQGQGVGVAQVQGLRGQAQAEQQHRQQQAHGHHSSARATCTRSANGLNR